MSNINNDNIQNQCVDENKRNFLKNAGLGALALATVTSTTCIAQQVLADEVNHASVEQKVHIWEYHPSTLGIDYTVYDYPMGQMLSQGEAEWLKNARADYMEDTEEAWKISIVPRIGEGKTSKAIIADLKDFTPTLLQMFAVGLDPQSNKYGRLFAAGSLFLAERVTSI
ncbi:MAG: hypothetical protein JKY08_07540 [Flavobacteriaceae bacterium]|nr:hypothetical protein [Flavobacteriaceae bacterium]